MNSNLPPRCMIREQLIARLESEMEGVSRMRLARRLATDFIHRYGIFPHGVNLIPWLTRNRCRNNTEALVDWIESQLEEPGFADDTREAEPAFVLARRLERVLSKVEASYPW